MSELTHTGKFRTFLNQYGMLGVLLLLCLFFSLVTIREQQLNGEKAVQALYTKVENLDHNTPLVIAVRPTEEERAFGAQMKASLEQEGFNQITIVEGEPRNLYHGLARELLLSCLPEHPAVANNDSAWSALKQDSISALILDQTEKPDYLPINILCLNTLTPLFQQFISSNPIFSTVQVETPAPWRWPTFLLPDNLRNIANQISVIAVVAVGMTMVIITGGIDLSVGSLIAFSAVLAAWMIRAVGGVDISPFGAIGVSLLAILVCGLIGAFSGGVVTMFKVPPFIATLGMMQVASGLAFILAKGVPIHELPAHYVILGRGTEPIFGIPWTVILMLLLYLIAHLLMSRTTLGRYIYAVGGNAEASRLAGVNVKAVTLFVYISSAALAGLGGVIIASQLKSGAPTYGLMYELYVIAAVVVGGTSLSGGEGKIFGTLIGAFIIAVIQNGMNLTNVESYTQKVVLGLVILTAVLLDRLKHQRFSLRMIKGFNRR